jgi:hypothetical protein
MANKYVISMEVKGITYFLRGYGVTWWTPNITEAKFFFYKHAVKLTIGVKEAFKKVLENNPVYPPKALLKVKGAYIATFLVEAEVETIKERELIISYL